jgi:hypothetical protein
MRTIFKTGIIMETRHDEETIRWPACRPVPIFLGLAALMDSGTGKNLVQQLLFWWP